MPILQVYVDDDMVEAVHDAIMPILGNEGGFSSEQLAIAAAAVLRERLPAVDAGFMVAVCAVAAETWGDAADRNFGPIERSHREASARAQRAAEIFAESAKKSPHVDAGWLPIDDGAKSGRPVLGRWTTERSIVVSWDVAHEFWAGDGDVALHRNDIDAYIPLDPATGLPGSGTVVDPKPGFDPLALRAAIRQAHDQLACDLPDIAHAKAILRDAVQPVQVKISASDEFWVRMAEQEEGEVGAAPIYPHAEAGQDDAPKLTDVGNLQGKLAGSDVICASHEALRMERDEARTEVEDLAAICRTEADETRSARLHGIKVMAERDGALGQLDELHAGMAAVTKDLDTAKRDVEHWRGKVGDLLGKHLDPDGAVAPSNQAISSSIAATDYKYFGDYPLSEGQWDAVITLIAGARHMATMRAERDATRAREAGHRRLLRDARNCLNEGGGGPAFRDADEMIQRIDAALASESAARPGMSTGSTGRQDVSTFDAFFDASAPPDGDGV